MTQKADKSFISRFALPLYFIIAFGLAWLCWGLAIEAQRDLKSFPVVSDLLQILGTFSPLVAALAVTMQLGSTRDLLNRGLRWKVGLGWYFFALFAPALLMLLTIGIHVALGGNAPTFPHLWQLPLVAINFVVVILIGGPLGEELGWRGFALQAMQIRYGAVASSIGIGVMWAFWHLPLFWIEGSPQHQLPVVSFFLMTVALSVIFTWLFNKTNESVLMAMIFHSAINTWSGPLRILPSATGSLRPYEIATALLCVTAVVLILTKNLGLTGPEAKTTPNPGITESRNREVNNAKLDPKNVDIIDGKL